VQPEKKIKEIKLKHKKTDEQQEQINERQPPQGCKGTDLQTK